MRQIVYVSTAAELGAGGVDAIVDRAVMDNAMAGITGFLLFNGRNFLQLIEGNSPNLMGLIERLERDPRHMGIVYLADVEVSERQCPDWSMRLVRMTTSREARRKLLEDMLPARLDELIRRQVLSFATLN